MCCTLRGAHEDDVVDSFITQNNDYASVYLFLRKIIFVWAFYTELRRVLVEVKKTQKSCFQMWTGHLMCPLDIFLCWKVIDCCRGALAEYVNPSIVQNDRGRRPSSSCRPPLPNCERHYICILHRYCFIVYRASQKLLSALPTSLLWLFLSSFCKSKQRGGWISPVKRWWGIDGYPAFYLLKAASTAGVVQVCEL